MKKKFERIKKVSSNLLNQVRPKHQNQEDTPEDTKDEPYFQINKISFQENFKVLIGHYKNVGPESQAG
jgi:hypothetical protein